MKFTADAKLWHFLLLAVLYMTARSHSSNRVQFQQMAGQVLQGGQSDIRDMKTNDIEACAYLCIKDETCKSFSYHEIERVCTLSSAYPVIPDNEVHMLAVFMKVEDTVRISQGIKFSRLHELLMAAELQYHYNTSIADCGEICLVNVTCYGIQYYPLEATCMVFFGEQSPTPVEEVEASNVIIYLITREVTGITLQNIAAGKQASQSTNRSSQSSDYTADRAVNGDYTDFSSTGAEIHPYWMVDLGTMCNVTAVKIFTYKTSTWTNPVRNPIVYVGTTENALYTEEPLNNHPSKLRHPVCGFLSHGISEDKEFICQPPLRGRFVYKQLQIQWRGAPTRTF